MLRRDAFPPDPAHNPLNVIRGTPYEERHLDNFLSSQSEGETRSIMRKIDEEDSDRKVLDEAGAAGTIAQLAAGLIDPTILLPAGTIYRGAKGGYSVARSAASVGVAAGLQSTAAEIALQAGQETRTAGQSTAAIASSVLLAGLIGGGASKLLSNVERTALETALDGERVAVAAHAAGVPPPSVGRAQPAGAGASDTRQLEMELSGFGFSDRLSPTRRTLNASEVEPRRIMADLAETPYRFKENEEGIASTQGPSVDRMVRTETNAARVHIADELDRQFAEYRFNDADASVPRLRAQFERFTGSNQGKMSFTKFKQEVSRAAMTGDQHSIPQVAAAAQFVRRRVFDPWAERAENAIEGFERGQQAEGEAYFPHVWKKELITAKRPEFTNRLVEKYQADQTAKRAAQGRLSALNDELQDVGGKLAKAGEDEAAGLQARYDEVRTKIENEIGTWEGKSSKEAKSALKAREKAAAERADDAPRLRAADAAIDKAVKRILESEQDLSVQELRATASQTVDRILGSPDGRLPYDLSSGAPTKGASSNARGALAGRRLNVTNGWAAEWIEDDIERVATTHMRTVVPDVILTERFGDVDMTEAMRRINESYAQRIDTTKSEKQRVELGKEREAVIRDIAAVRDRVRGVYGYAPELKNMARVAGAVKNLNNLQSMGMAAVSSLPDLAGAVFRFGLTNTLRDGWAPFISNMVKPSPEWLRFKSQMRAIGIGIETATNARQHAIDDVMDVYQPQSRFERTLQGVSDKFFIANMLAPLTDVQKTIASHVAVSEILRATVTVAKGKGTKRLVGNLAESGIDIQMAGRIAEQFKTGGEVTNGVHLPNTADWTDRAAADALNGAVAREVDIAVVTPGQEKPLWMSHPVLSVLGQFKAFTASATERILIANLQRRDANVLSGVVASMALGMLAYKVNSLLGGQKTSDRPQDWIKEGINKGGLLGWFEEGNALASKMTRGGVDMYRMIGADKPLSRYASRSTLDMFLGPTAGKVQALSQATGAAVSGEWSESDTKAVRKLTVFQNLFWLRNALNQVEQGINGAAGVPMKAP